MFGQKLQDFVHQLFQSLLILFFDSEFAEVFQSRLVDKHLTLSPL
jgi:hypothetical protein